MELKFHPSAASRWMACTASPTIDVSHLVEPPRDYAEKGRVLHAIGEQCLRDGGDPVPGDGVTPDDCASVKEYVDFVRSRPGTKFYELKAEFVPGCRGLADVAILDPPWLEIIDYKSGHLFVDPEENLQMAIYALAIARKFRAVFDYEKVRLTIAQPAAENFNSWEISRKKLERLGKKIERTIERIRDHDSRDLELEFSPDEDRCRWCPAKPICPALQAHVNAVAAEDFRGADDLSWDEKMGLVPLLKEWCKGVEAQARSMLLNGEAITGWKVVRGRAGNRSWKNEKRARRFLLEKWKLGVDQIEKPGTLLTPAAIEKVVKGDEDKPKKALKKLIEPGALGGPTVVQESDSRKELTKTELAKDDFANLPDDD